MEKQRKGGRDEAAAGKRRQMKKWMMMAMALAVAGSAAAAEKKAKTPWVRVATCETFPLPCGSLEAWHAVQPLSWPEMAATTRGSVES